MSVRSVLMASVLVLLALAGAASPVARAEDEPAKTWERIEYRADPARRRLATSLTLTSETAAELVLTGENDAKEVVASAWSLVRTPRPSMRFVTSDRMVLLFSVDAATGSLDGYGLLGVLKLSSPPRLNLWEETKRRTKEASSTFHGAIATFTVHPGGRADWMTEEVNAGFDLDVKKGADGALTLTFPDGASRVFRSESGCWVDAKSTEWFLGQVAWEASNSCRSRLRQLLELFAAEREEHPGPPKRDGIALLLSWWRKIPRPSEWVMPMSPVRCPGDPDLRDDMDSVRLTRDELDLEHPPLDLCSYAVRDFTKYPLRGSSPVRQILMCDRQGKDGKTPHHPGGICVAFDDGSVKFMTRADLGLKPDEPIVVGPDSKVEMLRMMCQVPKR